MFVSLCGVLCMVWHGMGHVADELDQQRAVNHRLQEDMDQCIGELQNL